MKPGKILIAAIALIAVGIAAYIFWPHGNRPVVVDDGGQNAGGTPAKETKPQVVGGVLRPGAEGRPSDTDGQNKSLSDDDAPDYGTTPPVAIDANPTVAALAKVVANRKKDPDAYRATVSVLAKVNKFQLEKYRTDKAYRENYLKSVEPARAFQSAQPGKDVEQIAPMSPLFQTIRQGEVAQLRVVGVPGTPYTFTSFDLGRFVENSLTTVTVEADEKGFASVKFFAAPGTIGDVHILVAGPQTSGQVRYIVNIQEASE